MRNHGLVNKGVSKTRKYKPGYRRMEAVNCIKDSLLRLAEKQTPFASFILVQTFCRSFVVALNRFKKSFVGRSGI